MTIRVALMTAVAVALVGMASVTPVAAAITPTAVEEAPGSSDLNGVACMTATSCVAVGFVGGFTGDQQEAVMVPITNGVPQPAEVVPGAQVLNGVACPTATFCLAVGIVFVGSPDPAPGFHAVIVPITNGVPGEPQVLAGRGSLNGIACSSATTCVAVGGKQVVLITNGVAGAPQPVTDVDTLNAVACSSSSSCLAVGSAPGDFFTKGVVVPVTDGVPGVAVPATGSLALNAIVCPGATTCWAVGNGDFFAGFFQSVVIPVVNGSVGPPAELFVTPALGIACVDATDCAAVGFSDTGMVAPIVDGTPGPPQPVPGTTALRGVTCPTATACLAVGGTGEFPDYIGVVVTITHVPDATALSCTPGTSAGGAPINICTVSDPQGIRTVLVRNTATNQQQASLGFDCSSPPTSLQIKVPAGTRYKVFVTDCNTPRVKMTFVIRANGSVNQV